MGLEEVSKSLKYIPLSHEASKSEPSALKLVTTLFPEWEHSPGTIEFVRFTDGITNTVLPLRRVRLKERERKLKGHLAFKSSETSPRGFQGRTRCRSRSYTSLRPRHRGAH